MKIIFDIIVISAVYFIGYSMGMKFCDNWWKQKMGEIDEMLDQEIQKLKERKSDDESNT